MKYTLWYGHSGEWDRIHHPFQIQWKTVDADEIAEAIAKAHHITHMAIDGVVPPLDVIAPKLTHLRITGVTNSTQLERYYC